MEALSVLIDQQSILGSATNLKIILLTVIVIVIVVHNYIKSLVADKRKNELYGSEAPGPSPLPILGSLLRMHGYKIPYAAFTAMSKAYGNVFSITLGTKKCLVVNDQSSVREVLSEKDQDFDSRPDFKRFDDALFGGDKQNSLAFCDNTEVHGKRRQLLKPHTFPHSHSFNWTKLDDICQQEMKHMLDDINGKLNTGSGSVDIKTLVAKVCGNIFNDYFCSMPRRPYDDPALCEYIESFDKIFYEVNNGRAMDFLPWLKPLMFRELGALSKNAKKVGEFVDKEIIEPKRQSGSAERRRSSADFLDGLMDHIDETAEAKDGVELKKEHALYALEDILGGHIGVCCIAVRNLIDLANGKSQEEDVQAFIRQQIAEVIGDAEISLNNKKDIHMINASMNETIRLTCSPIVPHQATRNSMIGGYRVEKGTIVFVNNHKLNMSDELWEEPERYNPFRFLADDGSFKKPDHFQPFSVGRRSCMGYKIVQIVSYFVIANLLSHYDIENSEEDDNPEIQYGMLALPTGAYTLKLTANSDTKIELPLDAIACPTRGG